MGRLFAVEDGELQGRRQKGQGKAQADIGFGALGPGSKLGERGA